MDEDRSQKDAALSHSDGGPLRQVRDPSGLESEGLTPRSGSILKSRSPHMSQISDSQALIESSAVTAQGQAVLGWGYRGGSPTAVRPSDPARLWELSPSHPILV